MPSMQLRRDDVIVGVDTHKDNHVAVAIDGFGGRLGDIEAPQVLRRSYTGCGSRVRAA